MNCTHFSDGSHAIPVYNLQYYISIKRVRFTRTIVLKHCVPPSLSFNLAIVKMKHYSVMDSCSAVKYFLNTLLPGYLTHVKEHCFLKLIILQPNQVRCLEQ